MSKRTYFDEPIFDIPRIPENEDLFASALDEELGQDPEERDGALVFEKKRE